VSKKQKGNDIWADWREYWKAYAQAFAQPIQANGLLSRFVTNPNVTGAYAEAWVRSLTRNMLGHRFRISTGAVIRECDKRRGLSSVPQCDLIVWDPSEMPAIFESAEFALVPLFAARAIIEIKRKRVSKDGFTRQLRERRQLLAKLGPDCPILGVVIRHSQPLFDQECKSNWLAERSTMEPPITRLLDGHNEPDTNGIMAFIYFLAQVAGHSARVAGHST
jgi:hypothetical protein